MSILLILSLISIAFSVEVTNREYPHFPNEYIVTYHTNTTVDQALAHWKLMESVNVEFIHKYNTGFHKGFAAKIFDDAVVAALQEDPLILAIEMNGIAYANYLLQEKCTVDHRAPSWGLARVSHSRDISTGISAHYQYSDHEQGEGVQIFIIDTGIQVAHQDFGGRAVWGIAFENGQQVDGNGHGTHCAGTAAGTTYGIAKKAQLVAVKVLGAGGSGSWADVTAGVNWVTEHSTPYKAVASMSLGGSGTNVALTNAINQAVQRGVTVVVASGNSNGNSCNFTPSNIASVISVGATALTGASPNQYDSRATYSNYGTCTHIWAPGTNIASAWIGASNVEERTISGTSMACPHVAGYAAILQGSSPTNLPAEDIRKILQDTAQSDLIEGIPANPVSPNKLLYNGCNGP